MTSEQDIIDEYGQCVWLLECEGEPHLIYATQDDLLKNTTHFTWDLIDSDVMMGVYGDETFRATPWPVLSYD